MPAHPLLLSLVLLPPLLLAAPEEGKPKEDPRAAIRSGVEDLARSLGALRMGSPLPRDLPSLTDQVNALLAAPPADLATVLGPMLEAEAATREGAWGDAWVKRVAAFLAGVPQKAEVKFDGVHLVEMHGFALTDFEGDGSYSSPGPPIPPEPEVTVSPGTRFRSRLRPRPFELLKAILSGDPEAKAAGEASMGYAFRASAGLELGDAARKDPEFAKFLLAACAEKHGGEMVPEILAAALGRWAGPGAVEELRRRFREGVRLEDDTAWYHAVVSTAAALRAAGADAALGALVKEALAGLPPDRRAEVARLAGGDATAGALLETVLAGPTAENLATLANAINDAMEPAESAGLRLRIFGEAVRIRRESKDDMVRGWALAVLQNSLWAGLYWRFGYMQGKNFSEDSDRAAPMPWGAIPETERDYFLGAWPDPEAQGRALGEDLAAGRVRVDERWKGPATGRGGAESIELWMGRAPMKDPGLDVKGRREGESVVLSVSNRRKTPVAVNTLAPKYAVAVMVPLAGEPKGRVELDLQAGRVLPGYRLLANPGAYRRIAPGETFEMTFAAGKLPAGSRVLLTLRDEMEPDGDPGCPVLRQVWELRIP